MVANHQKQKTLTERLPPPRLCPRSGGVGHNRPPMSQQAALLFDHRVGGGLQSQTEPRFATAAAGLAPTADASEACRRSTGGRVHPATGAPQKPGEPVTSSVGQLWSSSAPSARMCKRCSLLTGLRRDRAEVSLFQWRKRRHIYRVAAAYAVVACVLLQLVKAELLGGITCVISLGRSP
jgi:hypothetical protein